MVNAALHEEKNMVFLSYALKSAKSFKLIYESYLTSDQQSK